MDPSIVRENHQSASRGAPCGKGVRLDPRLGFKLLTQDTRSQPDSVPSLMGLMAAVEWTGTHSDGITTLKSALSEAGLDPERGFELLVSRYATSSSLRCEYQRWAGSRAFLQRARANYQGKLLYELNNILCRFLLGWYNFPKKRLRALNKAHAEIMQKNMIPHLDVQLLSNHQQSQTEPTLHVHVTSRQAHFQVNSPGQPSFNFELEIELYRKLVSYTDVWNMARMLMRYDSVLCQNGNFWGIPTSVWNYLVLVHGAEYEGFASPLNFNLTKFYSLFPDVDAPFGSQGNFLESKLKPGVYVANPPYSEQILEASSSHTLRALESTPGITVFMLVPNWIGAKGIDTLLASKYLVGKITLEPGHWVRNCLKGQNIVASFTNLFLVLSNTPITVDLEILAATFK